MGAKKEKLPAQIAKLEQAVKELDEQKPIRFYIKHADDLSGEEKDRWNKDGLMESYSGKVYTDADVIRTDGPTLLELGSHPTDTTWTWTWQSKDIIMLNDTWDNLIKRVNAR